MNISKETISQLEEICTFRFTKDGYDDCDVNDATEIQIGYEKLNGNIIDEKGYIINYIGKAVKATKKEISIDYLLNRINTDKTFENFTKYFNKLLHGTGINAYPASYGIGIFVAIGFRNNIDKTKNDIESKLNELNIKYITGYSDAGWVFRYKISKSKENINLIKKLENHE